MTLEELLEPIGFKLIKHESLFKMKLFKKNSTFLSVYHNHKSLKMEYHVLEGEIEVYKTSKVRVNSLGLDAEVEKKCIKLFNYIASFYNQELKKIPADFKL
ncbi:hypothetical protein GF352_04305 [archaeon]|nr:hypothetical protein [archaeon]